MNAITPGSTLGRWKCIGAILSGDEKGPAPEGAGPKDSPSRLRFRPQQPADFPILALADLLVQPFGTASTYSRCALGAIGNLWGLQGPCKGATHRKNRILRILNNQHFHSALCNLWITRIQAPSTLRTSDESGSPFG